MSMGKLLRFRERPQGVLPYFVWKYGLSISWILSILSLFWICLYPLLTISTGEWKPKGTYFSENALLPRVALPLSSQRLEQQVRTLATSFAQAENQSEALMSYLHNQSYLEVYTHEFTTDDKKGTNVYAILRASARADGKESLVLVANPQDRSNPGPSNPEEGELSRGTSVTLALVVMHYLSTVKWLSKDMILLLPDEGTQKAAEGMCHGTKAWLKAYHTDPLADLNAQFLPAHAGTIRGAVAIELDSTAEAWTSVSVLPHGQNGQLPNLDLVNLAVKAVQSERIQVVFDREPSLFGSSILTVKTHLENLLSCVGGSTGQDVLASTIFQRYWPRLQTLLQFMYTLVKGPNGVHGDFISYNIDSISIAASGTLDNGLTSPPPHRYASTVSITSFLRIIEVVVHSLSNLEEKLHQSFYFYLLLDDAHFVSIGEFYYAIPLLMCPSLVTLLRLCASTLDLKLALATAMTVLSVLVGWTCFQACLHFSHTLLMPLLALGLGQCLCTFILFPLLKHCSCCAGSLDSTKWSIQQTVTNLAIQEQQAQKKGLSHLYSEAETLEMKAWAQADVSSDTGGGKALKVAGLCIMLFSMCILGIMYYPFALAWSLGLLLFPTIEPASSCSSWLKKGMGSLVMLATSPMVLGFVGRQMWFHVGLPQFLANSAFMLPFFCGIYFPIHTLFLTVWFKC